MARQLNHPRIDNRDYVLPVLRGGTSSSTAEGAVLSLGVVSNEQKNQAGSAVGLDDQGRVSSTVITAAAEINLLGSSQCYISVAQTFTITDYDSFKSYEIAVSAGSFTRDGATITYTPPDTAQFVILNINSRTIELTVSLPAPAQPTVVTPAHGAVNQLTTSLSATSSAFAALGDASTHLSSDWQLATDSGFTTIVAQTTDSATDKTNWSPTVDLLVSAVHYIRVRHRGSNNNYSAWSAVSSFSTKALSEATVETQFLSPDYSGFVSMGYFPSISDDGQRVVCSSAMVSEYSVTAFPYMRTYVFHKANGVWSKVFTVDTTPVLPAGNTTPWNVPPAGSVISPDGLRLFVLEPHSGNRVQSGSDFFSDGRVLVYAWSGTAWALEATLSPAVNSLSSFGCQLVSNSDASKIVVFSAASSTAAAATVTLYTRSGTTWTARNTVTSTRSTNVLPVYGRSSLSRDGTRLALAYPYLNASNLTGLTSASAVCAVIYTVSATALVFEQDISVTAGAAAMFPGKACALSSDGSTMLLSSIGGAGDTNTNSVSSGAVYVYTRSGTTWAFETRITNDDAAVAEKFGEHLYLSTDGTKFVASASSHNTNGISNKGSYCLYEKIAGTWTLKARVTSSQTDANEFFSSYLTASSDLSAIASAASNKLAMFV